VGKGRAFVWGWNFSFERLLQNRRGDLKGGILRKGKHFKLTSSKRTGLEREKEEKPGKGLNCISAGTKLLRGISEKNGVNTPGREGKHEEPSSKK